MKIAFKNIIKKILIDLHQIKQNKSIYTLLFPIEIGHLNLISKQFAEFNAFQTFILNALDSGYSLEEISHAINVPKLSIKTVLNGLVKTGILDEQDGTYCYNEKSLYLKKIGSCINNINNSNTFYLNCFSGEFETTDLKSLYKSPYPKSFGNIYELPQKKSVSEIDFTNRDEFFRILEISSSIFKNLDDEMKYDLKDYILQVNPTTNNDKMFLPVTCEKYPSYSEDGGKGPFLFEGHVQHLNISYSEEGNKQYTDIWYDLAHGIFYHSFTPAEKKKDCAFSMPSLYSSSKNDFFSKLILNLDLNKDNIQIESISEDIYYVRCKIEDIRN